MSRPLNIFLISLLFLSTAQAQETPTAYSTLSQPLGVHTEALKLPLKNPRIVVKKSERTLSLYEGKKLLRVYRIGLGFEPTGPKEKQGDGKTPEGDYLIVGKNPKSQFYLSLALSYPNPQDAKSGLDQGTINRGQYDAIRTAARNRTTPPWDTPLGGEIFIHGHGSRSDWTLGCIALENEEMKELYQAVPAGTPVRIIP